MESSFFVNLRVCFARLMSSMLLVTLMWPAVASAHEVLPTISDMTQVEDTLVFDMRMNLESVLAGINQAEVTDTNDSPQAATYDELHALPNDAIEAAFTAFWPEMMDNINVIVDGERSPLTLNNVTAAPLAREGQPRISDVQFTATIPAGAESVEVSWAREYGGLVLRQMDVAAPYDGFMQPGEATPAIALAGGGQLSGWATFFSYIPTGFDHIVPLGLDHILFVLGLFFLSTHLKPLLWQVSAFTLAHTITLAMAALGYVTIPASIVEPLIALSIAYVAIENLFNTGLSRWRPFIIFGFGLLHGLGFASVLAQFGLPEANFVPALIGFNLGVEVGQLTVIAVAYICVMKAQQFSARGERNLFAVAGYLVAMTAVIALAIPIAGAGLELVDLLPVLATVGVLLGLCAVSTNTGVYDSYTFTVAQPASVLIALVAIYWTVERVFF